MKTVAIVNPIAGKRRALKMWPILVQALGLQGAHLATWWTEGPGHAEILAARARRQAFDRVIAAGGDGTVLEVVNGLWWESQGRLPTLGVMPFGTGCDYARNFDIGHNPWENLATALGEATIPVDAGICQVQGLQGQPWSRLFVNVLGMGFDANVVERFRRRRFSSRGKIAYVIAGLQELLHLRYYQAKGEIDGQPLETNILTLVVGLGRSFGAGMMIAPGASPQSGRFQLVWGQLLSRLEVLGLLPRIYGGRHLGHPKIQTSYASRLRLRTDPPAYVEAEGELIGRTPIEVKLVEAAFHLACRSLAISDSSAKTFHPLTGT